MVLGVSHDGVEDNRKFADKFQFPFPLLCDTRQEISKAYGAFNPEKPAYPRRISYLIDGAGKIAHVYDKVDPKVHVAEVLKAV